MLVLLTSKTCGICKILKTALNNAGIEYSEYDVQLFMNGEYDDPWMKENKYTVMADLLAHQRQLPMVIKDNVTVSKEDWPRLMVKEGTTAFEDWYKGNI